MTSSNPTWLHKARGTTYEEIGRGLTQSCDSELDNRPVVVYRGLADGGRLWVRPVEEFEDGRFESGPPLKDYQGRVAEWMMKCFGADITNSLQERCFRFFEEAGELCQALGMTEDRARDLVTYTWSRDKGEPSQEVGGAMVTLAAMCHAAGLDMAAEGETELARINTPETIDKIRHKHHAKTLRTPHSALPGDV